jgi:hypothetical protein
MLLSKPSSSKWSTSLLSCFPTKTLYAPLPPCVTHPTYLIFLNLIIREIFGGNADLLAVHYSICSYYAQTSSSTRYSQTLSAYVSPSTRQTKFQTHKYKKQNYRSVHIYLFLVQRSSTEWGVSECDQES